MYTPFLIAVIVAEKFFDWYRGLFRYCSGGGCLENRSSFVNFLRLTVVEGIIIMLVNTMQLLPQIRLIPVIHNTYL